MEEPMLFDDERLPQSMEKGNKRDEQAKEDTTHHRQVTLKKYCEELEDLPYFNGSASRTDAEALLLQNGYDGSYLIRRSTRFEKQFSISVRCNDSIKHIELGFDPSTNIYVFGKRKYKFNELIQHFNSRPVLTSESNIQVTLRYPYVKEMIEPDMYDSLDNYVGGGPVIAWIPSTPDIQIGSKEGYLTKRGAIHKNWKKRWFALQKCTLQYFKTNKCSVPIRTINLRLANSVSKDDTLGKEHCFHLRLPDRIYYFHAECFEEAEQWIEMLQWKIDYYSNMGEMDQDTVR